MSAESEVQTARCKTQDAESGQSAILHFAFCSLTLALLALGGCGHHPRKVVSWVWPGANRFNTLFFAQAGTRPSPVLRYSRGVGGRVV